MPSDYAAIANQHRDEYGSRVSEYGKVLLQLLYSDRTHFVYELLQNAEDAGARKITFTLFRNRLEVSHNGRAFDERDVRAICGIVAGTKTDDLTAIGRFGIGFKSVYAYTSSPEIHSGDEHFAIRDYVYPRATEAIQLLPGETRQIFPFNHKDIDSQTAFREIGTRLKNLGARTLLFLRSIADIEWSIEGGGYGTYLRESRDDLPARRIVLVGEATGENSIEEQWIVFSRGVPKHPGLKVEVAFKLAFDARRQHERIEPISNSHLVVFFPTEKETHLGFLLQGPYRTTPARDNIPGDNPWNQELIRQTAELVIESLTQLRKRRLLTVSALEALPIRAADFPPGSMFRPIFDAVLDAFKTQPLLPTDDGRHVSADQAILTDSADIRALLDEDQVQVLFGSRLPRRWLSREISPNRTRDLWGYLTQSLGFENVDGYAFARRISAEFMAKQSDEWVAQFYAFLLGQGALWRRADMRSLRGPLGDKPIIRLENGAHVTAFRSDGKPNAFFGTEPSSQWPIVRRSIAAHPEARSFLEQLGITAPDVLDVVIQQILPKYAPGRPRTIADDEHMCDIETIVQALTSPRSDYGRLSNLKSQLMETKFLYGVQDATHKRELVAPSALYSRTPELETYFRGSRSIWFLDERYEPFERHLRELGIADRIRTWGTAPDRQDYVHYKFEPRSYERGVRRFDPTFEVDELKRAVTVPFEERSRFIWNTLLPRYAHNIRGEIEKSTRDDFAHPTRQTIDSPSFGRILKISAWLPDAHGAFHTPSELSIDDLPAGFERNWQLATLLGMRQSEAAKKAEELGVTLEDIELIKEDREAFEAWKRARLEARAAERGENGHQPLPGTFDFQRELRDCFDQPGLASSGEPPVDVPPGRVPNPDGRIDQVRKAIKGAQRDEPPREKRFTRVPTKRWEAKDNQVRETLRGYYDGKCQVCGFTFPKRDGTPYFEGMYLVSYTGARWIDHVGNVLCLCANCCAKLMHGSLVADVDVIEQIEQLRARMDAGDTDLPLRITLCGAPATIRYSQRHLIDLIALLEAGTRDDDVAGESEAAGI